MTHTDQLIRFLFEGTDIRGEIITLEKSYQQVLQNGNYPLPVQSLLGQMLAAAGLLSATMKFDGIFTLQARGDGDLSLVMADCTRQHLLRGIAKLLPGASPDTTNIRELLGEGYLAITVDPAKGERYQGIVPLEGENLASCLENYFSQSEQLPTRLWLYADGSRAGGLLIQALPQQLQTLTQREDFWQHLCVLADTVQADEFLSTDTETLLVRLFHEESVRLFPATEMEFACSCSRTRTGEMLASLGAEELRSLIEEKGIIEVLCEFCHQQYHFDGGQIDALFNGTVKTLH